MKKENEGGYEYCERLYRMITKNKKHTLPLDEAVDFISFYGLEELFYASGQIGFIGKVAIDRLDHALVYENYRLVKKLKEGDQMNSFEWIPVSERLPEEYIHVLCQFTLGGMGECYLAHGVFHVVGGLVMTCNEVIAWMPLPKPYEESEDAE